MFTRCFETIWKDNLQNATITPPIAHVDIFDVQKLFLRVKKIPSSHCQHVDFMRPGDVYTVCLRLFELLPSKHLHNPFKWLKWKRFIDIQKVSSRLNHHHTTTPTHHHLHPHTIPNPTPSPHHTNPHPYPQSHPTTTPIPPQPLPLPPTPPPHTPIPTPTPPPPHPTTPTPHHTTSQHRHPY